jgi:hypothetical protein
VEGRVSVVAFERDSSLEGIWGSGFRKFELQSIVIPSSVVFLGKESFYRCKSLESVIFESASRLERIEERAFYRSGLKSILIPSSVVILGRESFSLCGSLESVIFENGSRLERTEKSAFGLSGLKWIEIPSSVVILGIGSFTGCRSLESVTFESGSRLERIDERAFATVAETEYSLFNDALESIVIPSCVIVLDKSCFYWCRSLESVTFESGSRLERIAERAFYRSGLKSILIPSSVVVLGKSRFCGCESIVIPSSVVVLGQESFRKCKSLESVTFESGSRLERIEECVCFGSGLKSIAIPCSVTFIDGSAFGELSLASIGVSPDNMRFRVREYFLEHFDGSRIYRYFGSCHSIVIPSSVFVLGKMSFHQSKSLESVTFESGS